MKQMFQPIIKNWDNDDSLFKETLDFLKAKNVPLKGILHIGAHLCEEKQEYNDAGVEDTNIVWIEGNEDLYRQNKERGIQNLFFALLAECEKDVTFHITNNKASSSIYSLDLHKLMYPHIVETEQRSMRTTTISKIFSDYNLSPSKYNIWLLDIQGAEYDALCGGVEFLKYVDAIYVEINFKSMYKDIPLFDTVFEFLVKNDFILTHVKNWQNSWGDALFLKRSFF